MKVVGYKVDCSSKSSKILSVINDRLAPERRIVQPKYTLEEAKEKFKILYHRRIEQKIKSKLGKPSYLASRNVFENYIQRALNTPVESIHSLGAIRVGAIIALKCGILSTEAREALESLADYFIQTGYWENPFSGQTVEQIVRDTSIRSEYKKNSELSLMSGIEFQKVKRNVLPQKEHLKMLARKKSRQSDVYTFKRENPKGTKQRIIGEWRLRSKLIQK